MCNILMCLMFVNYSKYAHVFRNQRCRVHAFVPGSVAASLEPILEIGKIYLFNNFTAKDYKADEKFRPVHKTWQIVLGQETKITSLDENEVAIDKAAFDFYDLADLKDLANQSTYLTGTYNSS